MLPPNHTPLTIAEQFGLLAGLYPERVDLALGRGAGGDPQAAARAGEDSGVAGPCLASHDSACFIHYLLWCLMSKIE